MIDDEAAYQPAPGQLLVTVRNGRHTDFPDMRPATPLGGWTMRAVMDAAKAYAAAQPDLSEAEQERCLDAGFSSLGHALPSVSAREFFRFVMSDPEARAMREGNHRRRSSNGPAIAEVLDDDPGF